MSERARPSTSILSTSLLRIPEDALRGVGQIVLQDSPWTGLAILGALLVEEPKLALGCALGALFGNLGAGLLRRPASETRAGLHGFNGALVGTAAFVFFPSSSIAWALATVGASLSTALARLLARALPIPAFTAPFVLLTWLALLAFGAPAQESVAISEPAHLASALAGVLPGVGQIVFAGKPLAGALVLVGIGLGSLRHALFALSASALSVSMALAIGVPGSTVAAGLCGYSAALTAIALAGRGPVTAGLGVVVTLALQYAGGLLGFPVLTAPFVLGTWAVLVVLLVGSKERSPEAA